MTLRRKCNGAKPVSYTHLDVYKRQVLNPTFEEQARSDLNIVFAASRDALTMVEGEATFVPEDVIIDALEWGRKEIQPLIDAQLKLRELAGKEKMPFTPHQDDPVLVARVQELAREAGLEEAMRVPEKLARKDARKAVKDKVMEALLNDPAWAESCLLYTSRCV